MKSLFSITLAMIIIILSFTISYANNENESTEFVKYYYNSDYSESLSLNELDKVKENQKQSSQFSLPKHIIGEDSRQQVNPNNSPYSRVVLLLSGYDEDNDNDIDNWYPGTGFMIYNNIMITTAHNMFSHTYGVNAKEMRIYVKNNSNNFNTTYYYPYSWVLSTAYTSSFDSNYDWCVVQTQNNIGTSTGWFGYSTASSSNRNVYLSGYPTDHSYFQYSAAGIMNSISSYRVSHNVDSYSGQSGAPLYDSNGYVYAIHTGGDSSLNYGCRITSSIVAIINDYKNN